MATRTPREERVGSVSSDIFGILTVPMIEESLFGSEDVITVGEDAVPDAFVDWEMEIAREMRNGDPERQMKTG